MLNELVWYAVHLLAVVVVAARRLPRRIQSRAMASAAGFIATASGSLWLAIAVHDVDGELGRAAGERLRGFEFGLRVFREPPMDAAWAGLEVHERRALYWHDDGYRNGRGHRRAAATIDRFLTEHPGLLEQVEGRCRSLDRHGAPDGARPEAPR